MLRFKKPKTIFFQSQSSADSSVAEPPWKAPASSSDTGLALSSALDRRLPTSYSSPGLNNHVARLPKVQNPTVTLLQKARGESTSTFSIFVASSCNCTSRRPNTESRFVYTATRTNIPAEAKQIRQTTSG